MDAESIPASLNRLHLTYNPGCLTPSTTGSPEAQEYASYDEFPCPPLQEYNQYSFPQPYYSNLSNLFQHQPYYSHSSVKPEYGSTPISMADIPVVTQDIAAKDEYADDDKPGMMEMNQDEVDAIIRNKRKVRDPKACYACHRRKVKCDRNLPCDSCVKRDHPELCSYERPTKKRRIALSNALAQADGGQNGEDRVVESGPNITVPKEQWEKLNRELSALRAQTADDKDDGDSAATEEQSASGMISQSDEADREVVHAPSNQMGTMHLGSRSVLAYMLGNRTKSTQDAAQAILEKDILPSLGLDNETTTYPFVDLWSTESSMRDVNGLVQALPEDNLCREFWLTYRDIPCVIYPVVPDTQDFDNTLNSFLHSRAESQRTGTSLDPNKPYGAPLPWLALLFAVLASGSQSTGRPAKERELTSQVYICCSYQALRMSNFLTHPSLDTIEALLIIGNALSYNMNPGVSYVLLGMTLRSAFSMGLHVYSPAFSEHENYLRSRIWWALAWQDSHFSVSYDRPSSSILCAPALPFTKYSVPGSRTYVESMTSIIKLTQEILRERNLNPKHAMTLAMITRYKDEVYRIWNEALPRFRDYNKCVSMTDHLERLALQIHCSYMISEICRPALKEDHHPTPTSTHVHPAGKQSPVSPGVGRRKSSLSTEGPLHTTSDSQIVDHLRSECFKYLERTVDTYVELRSINKFAARSWVGIQRSISAAFLLGVLPETRQRPEIISKLTELEKGLFEAAIEDSGFPKAAEFKSPAEILNSQGKDSPQWLRTMTKSLNALSSMNATLATGKHATAATTTTKQYPMPHSTTYHGNGRGQAAGVYNTPMVSPTGDMAAHPQQTGLHQYPMIFTHPATPGNPLASGPQVLPGMGLFTPDSAGGDWNYGNISERALQYVHPGLWG